jgi:hypothetical protein
MRRRLSIFFFLLFLLLLYTELKISPFVFYHHAVAWILTVLFFVIMTGWQITYRVGYFKPESDFFKAMAWVGSFALGFLSSFIMIMLPLDGIKILISLIRDLVSLLCHHHPSHHGRRIVHHDTDWF